MNDIFVQFGMIYILIAAFLAARPWFSRKNVLFGVVFGSGEIRRHSEARNIVRRFVTANIILAAAIWAALFLLITALSVTADGSAQIFVASVFILLLAEAQPYIIANRAMKRLKETMADENLVRDSITVELGAEEAKRPVHAAWFLLLLAPVVLTAALAAYYFPQMPDRVPTHFDLNGDCGRLGI